MHRRFLPRDTSLEINFPPPVPPRITPFVFEDNPVSAGKPVQATCFVPEGDLPLDITWTLNGAKSDDYVEMSVGRIGRRNSILTIESVSYANAGNYTCRAANLAGEAAHNAQLLVNGY